ncbi:protein of unknown function [Flavobacterium johnsoniae]|uniref:eCIS core domain-containing protein n=1 Tax=Flavobacterium johnsoniae (strain ATCC 17061 / DSM 2064 / JCM 8514 / BCRC 14874 / CCUG 350202 / NBRC 14942 / NCIMB 11054 / UW101) TaxID=376686 RepID=A5FF41_FLAJ1|nr:hypothetical protein Fjoh_3166 [Flavobacterium johnsoniae UW101]OXE98345.1 hypothetical protein B0A63_15470 [Flavobacterium johnsoniae UW101]SHK68173.1 protein of unknown function [Flavobacterium johnsoniae]
MPVLTKKTNTNPSHSSSHHDKGKESFFGIKAKLNIGKSNDKFEIEADRVADQVVANKQTAKTESFFSPSPVMQKKLARDVQKQEEQNKDVQQKTAAQTITPVVQLKEDLIQNKLDSRITEKRETNPVFSASKTLIQHKLEDKILKKEETIQNKTEVKKTETASKNILSPKPLIQNKGEEENLQQKKEEEKQAKDDEKQLQKSPSGDASPSDNSNLESKLNSSKGGGSPLSGKVKTEMESGIGADFSNVRIHNDSNAVQMNKQLGAQAFATGNNIYFNEGKYNPNSKDGKHLLAHELTHTVQQGAAIRKKPEPVSPAPEMIQGSLLSFAIPDFIKDNVRHVPGYTLLTVVAGYDPLNDVNVERNAVNLIEGFMGLIPFGTAIFDKLQEYGIIDRVFDWVNSRLSELGLSMDALLQLVKDAWDESSISTFIDVVRTKFNDLVNRVTTFASSLVDQIITWIKEALIEVAEPLLAENKAYSLLKKIIKYDPLRDKEVTATTVEILEDFLLLIDKQTELEQMREKGTLQKTADWLDTQVGTFNSLLGELRGLITTAWNAIQPSNLANISDNLSALAVQAGGFLQRVWDFASGVALKVLELVKESLLGWLSDQAKTVRGYSLVKVIIGKDPFTQEVVPRTVPNMIKGFMSLMDGGEEQYAQMVESGAIARITGEIEAAVATLNMTPQSIIQLFTDIWDSMTIDDLVHPIDAFMRIIEKFGEPIGRLIAFVAEIVRIVIMAILEIMNFPFDLIGNIITRALEAIDDIKKDPIGFLKNILRALKQGFVQFFDNIVTHLINGVTGWLMSELKDANIPVLTDFSLKGVITWIMEVLNISMEKIWEKLAAHPRIGPARVARIRSMINTLEGIWTFIKDVQERGMAAIWDKIQEQLSNLWNTVLDAVKNFVMERIVNRITARLLSMLDPTGIMAVINGAMAFFNAVQSFIKYLREMLEVVNSFVNGIADLARGNVATAADYLERTMGQAMPVVIGFLANQVGLTGIGARIGEMIISVQQMVDEALTWLVNKAVDTGMSIIDRLMGGSGTDNLAVVKQNLHQEEQSKLTNGAIKREEAQEVAQNVATLNNTLVNSISVVDGGQTWNYNIVQKTDEEDGPRKEEISIENATLEVVFEGNKIRLNFVDEETTAVIAPAVSDARLLQVLEQLKMDEEQAKAFFDELKNRNIINTNEFKQLLIAHARPKSAGMDPIAFLTSKLSLNQSTAAAWSRPQGSSMRNRGVNLGPDADGNQRETLSQYAQIFYEKEVGDWMSRPLERDAGPDEPRILEYIYQKEGNPDVISLGVVELNDSGEIIQIIKVNSNNISGGQQGLIQLLKRKGWAMRIP